MGLTPGAPVAPDRRRRRGSLLGAPPWVVAATVVVLGLLAVPGGRDVAAEADRQWHEWMVQLEWPVAVAAAHGVATLGGVWVTAPLRAAVAVWMALTHRWRWLAVWLASIATSELAIALLKTAYGRSRPPLSLEATDTASLPSGHTVATAVTAVVIAAVAARARDDHRTASRRAWVAVIVIIVAVGLSRTYLRVHWLSDVVAGGLLGAAIGLVCTALLGRQEPEP